MDNAIALPITCRNAEPWLGALIVLGAEHAFIDNKVNNFV